MMGMQNAVFYAGIHWFGRINNKPGKDSPSGSNSIVKREVCLDEIHPFYHIL